MVYFRAFGVFNSFWMVLLFVIFITNITPSLNQYVCRPGCCPIPIGELNCTEFRLIRPQEFCGRFCCPC